VPASAGLLPAAVAGAFKARYGYEFPLAPYGLESMPLLLSKLQAACSLVALGAGADGHVAVFPPVQGARSSFNKVRRRRAPAAARAGTCSSQQTACARAGPH
jgi:6-phosphogluconolactonase/glucosamine-6-phosphate isomerase/deaminase